MALYGKSGMTAMEMAISIAVQARLRVLVGGPPGVGKSAMFADLARRFDRTVRILVGSMLDPTDVMGLPVISEEGGRKITRFATPGFGRDLIQHPMGCLILEEVTQAAPSVQNALMRLANDREVGEERLPDSVWIIGCFNPKDSTGGTTDLTAALANRFLHFHIPMDPASRKLRASRWTEGKYPDLSEVTVRDDYARFVGKPKKLIGEFLTISGNEQYEHRPPTDPTRAGVAWPSARTWDYAALFMAACNLATIDGKEPPVEVYQEGLYACVGKEAADAFWKWLESRFAFSGEQVLEQPDLIFSMSETEMLRGLALAEDTVVKARTRKAERFAQIWNLYRRLVNQSGAVDVAAASAKRLLQNPALRNGQGGWDVFIPANDDTDKAVVDQLRQMGVLP